ncbi:AfsR/SARP family transcriptional regulator [Streptomyces sp. 4N509B]|uniref:AfsR/SARP family transcriptional regulator n=1 Tax=Streptomyces sp. 4N509B TaxID=3457413 RepID=UPI003FCFA380
MTATVRLLGAVEVWSADGRRATAGPPQQRCALAALALEPGHAVPVETLVDRVWADDPPANVREVLYSYVSRLRRVLRQAGGPELARGDGGYVLRAEPAAVDLHHSRSLVRQAREAGERGEWELAAGTLRRADTLWRGDAPLAGLRGPWAERVRETLRRERVTLLTARFEAELAAGRHESALPEVADAVVAHPLAEPLTGLLMTALYRCGRQADALAAYARTRRHLAVELGEEPGPELRELHRRVLTRDPSLDAPESAGPARAAGLPKPAAPGAGPRPSHRQALTRVPSPTPSPVPAPSAARPPAAALIAALVGAPPPAPVAAATPHPVVRPAQLPADVRGFTGRQEYLERLDAHLSADGTAPLVAAVVGTAGAGKTTLAVHWAHRVAHHFPDGQLYVNLRGFDPSGRARQPAEVLRGFLEAFGVGEGQMPAGTDELAAMYRSVLAGRRVMVVLDNARDLNQLRPLLPGAPGCLALVTSRSLLPGLSASTGGVQHALELFTEDEARGMLAERLGARRLEEEPAAVAEIITRCARLPLALAIVAELAVARPDFPLATLTEQLRAAGGGLDTLALGEEQADIRAVFSWSYGTLSPRAARLFRLLGLHPGPDLGVGAVAGLVGVTAREARRPLAELLRHNLLVEYVPGRYVLHDLLRDYAAELADEHEPPKERHRAVHRLLDYYLHSLHAGIATAGLNVVWLRDLGPAPSAVTPERFPDNTAAMAWLAAERRALMAAVEFAVREGLDHHATELGRRLSNYLDQQARWHDQVEVQQAIAPAALRQGEEAHSVADLARSLIRLRRYEEGRRCLDRALLLFREAGATRDLARVYNYLGYLSEQLGHYRDTLRYARLRLEIHRDADDLIGEAHALNAVGWSHVLLGEHERALPYCTSALALVERLGDGEGVGLTWGSLGHAYQGLGDAERAAACFRHSLAAFEAEQGPPHMIARAATDLGHALRRLGRPQAARDALHRALRLYEELHDPAAEAVRAALRADLP